MFNGYQRAAVVFGAVAYVALAAWLQWSGLRKYRRIIAAGGHPMAGERGPLPIPGLAAAALALPVVLVALLEVALGDRGGALSFTAMGLLPFSVLMAGVAYFAERRRAPKADLRWVSRRLAFWWTLTALSMVVVGISHGLGYSNGLSAVFLLASAVLLSGMAPGGYRVPVAEPKVEKKKGGCPGCGYDLRASVGQCPECGLGVPDATVGLGRPEDLRGVRRRLSGRRRLLRHIACVLEMREEMAPQAWDGEEREKTAAYLAISAEKAMSWPNGRFIAADPLLLMFGKSDWEIKPVLDRLVGEPLKHREAAKVVRMTLGEAVEWVVGRRGAAEVQLEIPTLKR